MSSIGTMFFILAPFGFFCTENGTGLITGAVFLILGFVFKWIGNGGLEPKIKVNPKDWWETNYRLNHAQGRGEETARNIADYTTRSNGFPMPSEEEKERIAKSMGIKTRKMEQDETDRYDRIQVGKYYLITELMEKYKNVTIKEREDGSPLRTMRWCYLEFYIKYEQKNLKFARDGSVGGYNTCHRFKKNDVEIWNSLSSDERNEAMCWVAEYEERLLKEVNDYVKNGIKMPTIKKSAIC